MTDDKGNQGSDRLAKLHQQQEKLKKQIALEKARLRGQERKDDTRRKIVAGAIALAHCERDENFRDRFFSLLSRFVDRDSDRALLDLPPKEKADAANDVRPDFSESVQGG
jgi:hypothetical protein